MRSMLPWETHRPSMHSAISLQLNTAFKLECWLSLALMSTPNHYRSLLFLQIAWGPHLMALALTQQRHYATYSEVHSVEAPGVAAMARAGVTVTGVLPDFGKGLPVGLAV